MQKSVIKSSFIYSLKRTIPILVGFFPVGVAYGLMMSAAGYGVWWTAAASLFVYTGATQMLMVSFFRSSLPIFSIIITTLLLNSRHLFYGIYFIDKFKKFGPLKYFLIHTLVDESYSIHCSYKTHEGTSEKWVFVFSAALLWIYWIVFSLFGNIMGSVITFDTSGIDFALTALFAVILTEQLLESRTKIPFFAALVSCALSFALFGSESFLFPSLCITVILLSLLKNTIEKGEKNNG